MRGLFTLLEVDSRVGSNDTNTRVPNLAVEITRRCQLSLEWDEMLGKYVISLSKFKLEEQLCIAADFKIIHMHRIQFALNAIT